jgi:hypothetical protein
VTLYTVLPDLDAALITFLDTHADLIPLHGGRVGTSLPAGGLTSIRIANLGGTMPWPWMIRAEFQVECWGGTEIQASEIQALTLARTVCAAIYELPATNSSILWAVVSLAPFASPDLVSNRFRYITQVELEATP